MKCVFCHTCLSLTRIDFPDHSYIYWFCDVCGRVFSVNMGKIEEVDGEMGKEVRLRNGFKGEKIKDV